MLTFQFTLTGTGTISPVVAGRKVIFYGMEFILGGATPPTSIQVADGGANPITPDLNGLIAGVVHRIGVNNSTKGFPVPIGVSAVDTGLGIIVTGGASPTVRGITYYELSAP